MTGRRTILLASDLTARSDRPTDRAFLLGAQLGATVLLLHVAGEHSADERLYAQAREALEAIAGHAAASVEIRVRSGEVHREIFRVADEIRPLLLVTGVARFNSVRDYLLGTAVDYLVRHSPVPVLVVKRRALWPYSRLLVATDFSDCSREALEAAATLFPDATATIWHSYRAAFEGILDPAETAEEARSEAESEMGRFVESAALPEGFRRRLDLCLEEGELHHRAAQTMIGGAYDLLVLGTHGRGGFAHATIGSRAAELLRGADRDTLIVRGAATKTRPAAWPS